ncbi:15310_t:CDS:2 [Acaulospora colombiana]|uniref:15310_t:CDS:1 n=1 Tax=Acaulospora colombiana TaxID=27376 RepID=A0ACA9LC38_9GLOM|nr:15310_t:CDS:2 [Acaulospora colombiana]
MPTSNYLIAPKSQYLMGMETDDETWDDIEIPISGLTTQGELDEMAIDNDDEKKESRTYRHCMINNGCLQSEVENILCASIKDSIDDVGEVTRVPSKLSSSLPSSDSAVTKINNSTSNASKHIKTVKSIFCASGLAKSTLNGNEEFTGTITRLGDESKKVVDMNDWDNDMEIPEAGLSPINLIQTRSFASNKPNKIDKIVISNGEHECFDNWDEEFQNFNQGEPCLPQSRSQNIVIERVEEPSKISSLLTSEKTVESFDQDFDLLDVDINKLNLSAETLKAHSNGGEGCEDNVDFFDSESSGTTTEVHSRNSSILSSPVSPSSRSQSEDEGFDDIQFPESMDSLRLHPHTLSTCQNSSRTGTKAANSNSWNMNIKTHRSFDDDSDDWSGLEVQDDNIFESENIKHKNIVFRTVPVQQKRPRRESFTIKFTPPSSMQLATENSPNFALDSPQICSSSMVIGDPQSPDSSSISPITIDNDNFSNELDSRDITSSPNGFTTKKLMAQKDSTGSTALVSKRVTSRPKREAVVSAKTSSATSSLQGYKANVTPSKNDTLLKVSGISSKPKEKGKSSMTPSKKSLLKKTNSSINATIRSTKENLSSPNVNHKKSLSICSRSTCSDSSEKSAILNFSLKSSTKNSKILSSPSSSANKKSSGLTSTGSLSVTKNNAVNGKTSQPRSKSSPTTNAISQKITKSQPDAQFFGNSNGGSPLIYKQIKSKNYGDGTELDKFDDLPICLEKERDFKAHPTSPVLNATNTNDDNVIDEMVYDPISQRWDGNELVLKDFEPSSTRLGLITNMSPSTNTKSLQGDYDMVFDTKKMCWFRKGEEEECLSLFDFESDCDEDNALIKHPTVGGFAMDGCGGYDNNELTLSPQAFSDNENLITSKKGRRQILDRNASNSGETGGMESGGNEFQVGSEFEMSKGFLKSLMASERQHRKEMNHWYPAIRSISNEQRFGLKDNSFQKGFLYEIRKSNMENRINIIKKHQKGGGLNNFYSSFREKSASPRCNERPHFR